MRRAGRSGALCRDGAGWVPISDRRTVRNCTNWAHPPRVFSQVFILKGVKVLCFDTLLQLFILKGLTRLILSHLAWPEVPPRIASRRRSGRSESGLTPEDETPAGMLAFVGQETQCFPS